MNLNNSQKRILLALNNQKNKIIVVDGPPETGKSHTIAALTYWANQANKSVLITSHKKEALDVIDRMLTEKFRNLHPKAIANYTTSLREHYRSFPEIIDYSNDFFYKPAQLELIINRIRTKPIGEVLQFINVETKGNSGRNVNFDEIDAITGDLKTRIENGYKGSIGIITSFREQQARMEQALNEQMNMPELKRNHKMAIWFVGDVQGEERDLVYYIFGTPITRGIRGFPVYTTSFNLSS